MLGVFCADQHKPRVDRAISAMVNQMRVLITDGGEFMHAVRRDRSSHRDALRLIDQFLFGAGVYPLGISRTRCCATVVGHYDAGARHEGRRGRGAMTDHPPIGVRQAQLDAERDAYEAQVRTPNPRHREIRALMNPYTMTPHAHYIANLQLAEEVADMPGAIVECGCWRGGMLAGIAMLLGDERDYWLFDSFEGLPPAQPVDGERAAVLDAAALIRQYFVTSEQVAAQAMDLAGAHRYHIVKGWFEHTLPGRTFEDGIAFLRVDGDRHDPSTLR